jgi:ubiquinone/menaquinone biosynthesis C-methylase UbiE
MKTDPETNFLSGMIELQYGLDVQEKLKKISHKISWAKGWPKNNEAFWNGEAFMWQNKIEKEKRILIEKEIAFLKKEKNLKNLDLGCGAYSYIPSVGFDFSEKMLQFNDNCTEKVIGDLEKKFHLKSNTFDSVTAIFVLNYIQNCQQLLSEVRRVMKNNGYFVMVIAEKNVNQWHKQKEINNYSFSEWTSFLEKNGFIVKSYIKKGLCFFVNRIK